MRTMRLIALTACLSLAAGQAAFAGSPLKGIEVRLCKGASDDCVAHQTDADGVADFGAQAKGDYTVVVPPTPDAVVTITGAGDTPIIQPIASDPSGRQRAARMGCHVWAVDTRLKVQVVAAAKVKSHSNTNNN